MPTENGVPTDEEIDAMSALWDQAPSVEEFPAEETAKIKADPDVLGWIESPQGEIFFRRDRKFFSPCQPMTADLWNLIFMGPDLRWCAAMGSPTAYYLQTASRMAKSPYHIKPVPPSSSMGRSDGSQVIY